MTYQTRDGLLWEAQQLLGIPISKVSDLRPHLPPELQSRLGTIEKLQEAIHWLRSQAR